MQHQIHPLISNASGTQRLLHSFHYGATGVGTKVYIQSSLHADELPGMLVQYHLRQLLDIAEQAQNISGEIVLVPVSNPIGLDQTLMRYQIGRFELASMENFNRNYPDFFTLLVNSIEPLLSQDSQSNKTVIRQAMQDVVANLKPKTELESMRQRLMAHSCDADIVLDLHCDYEAVMHMYVEEALLEQAKLFAQYIGAQVVLYANGSGAISFDESLSCPWWRLRNHFAEKFPIPQACFSTTVELRGQADVSHNMAKQDAQAIYAYLQSIGVVKGAVTPPTYTRFEPTPLSGTVPICTATPGVIVFSRQVGDVVKAGDVVAEIVEPISNQMTPLCSAIDGVIYARQNVRWATAGMEVARVAGAKPIRTGILLSP